MAKAVPTVDYNCCTRVGYVLVTLKEMSCMSAVCVACGCLGSTFPNWSNYLKLAKFVEQPDFLLHRLVGDVI